MQQAVFLLSHTARVDLDGNTFIEDSSENALCRQLAGASARTGHPMCSVDDGRPANITSLLAYWGGHVECDVGGGCACAIVLVSSIGEVCLHSWVAKPVKSQDFLECEMLALYGVLELLLNGVGVTVQGSRDYGGKLKRDCM
jgi:hypothetical protein